MLTDGSNVSAASTKISTWYNWGI